MLYEKVLGYSVFSEPGLFLELSLKDIICYQPPSSHYLLRSCSHECQHRVLVVLKVSVQKWGPTLGISAVHSVPSGYQGLHTLHSSD